MLARILVNLEWLRKSDYSILEDIVEKRGWETGLDDSVLVRAPIHELYKTLLTRKKQASALKQQAFNRQAESDDSPSDSSDRPVASPSKKPPTTTTKKKTK